MDKINSWNDVDLALKEIGECEIRIAGIEGDVTIACNKVKEDAKPLIAPFAAKKEQLEKLVTSYCEMQKAEFADKRSKDFNFGTVGYRLVKSVTLPRIKEKLSALIKALKAFKLDDCVETVESVSKEAIVELPDETLVKLGLKRTVKDSFRIAPKLEVINPSAGAAA